ncbi:hypothetical protein DdX_02482 [Ditylenchus destructor]|uniref:Uncharacterized protein n=1 Tax=Ditylenchus destructor TaxID=166010 RepID=A0AAD4NEB9_9BILA|nr:hypothetical protein DdX_02482 [Ditylenchus destructor]
MSTLKSNGNADSNFLWTVFVVTICSILFSNFVLGQCPRGTRSSTLPCVNGVCAQPQVCNNATGMCCAGCAQRSQMRRLSLQLNRMMNRGNSPFFSRANLRQWPQFGRRRGQGRAWRIKRNTLDENISVLAQELIEQRKAVQRR